MKWVAFVLVLWGSSSPTFPQKVGDTVVVVSAEAALTVGSAVKGTVPQGTILTVLHVGDEWFWVRRSGAMTPTVKGWIHRVDTLPLEPASRFFAEQLKHSPSAATHTILGAINAAQANSQGAIDEFSQAVRLDPNYMEASVQRARLWGRMKEFDKALADYNEIIRRQPANAEAHCGRSQALYAKGKNDEALVDCSNAIRLAPNSAVVYKARAIIWDDNGQYDKAIADYNAAARLDPDDADTYFRRGLSWLTQRQYERATADFDQALALNPDDADVLYNRGIARMMRQEYDKAISDLTRVLEVDPKSRHACWGLARIFATCPDERYRDGAKALQMATKQCDLAGWKDWTGVDNLAAAYAESGNFEAAVGWQQKAVRDAPKASKADCKGRLELYQARKPFHRKAED
jgi:tetratricopeptide (TPR) repeat protein